jgi:hypothetical protein
MQFIEHQTQDLIDELTEYLQDAPVNVMNTIDSCDIFELCYRQAYDNAVAESEAREDERKEMEILNESN